MKKYFYLMCLLVVGFAFASCDDDDDDATKYVETTLKFCPPADIMSYNPSFGIESLKLKDINTGKEISIIDASTKSSVSELIITVNVPEGVYSVNMEAVVSYKVNNVVNSSHMRSYEESVTITNSTATAPIQIPGYIYNASKDNGGFVISEIFFTGTETPEGKQYSGDAYFRIYNNSGDTLCADGLTIAESAFLTVDKQQYTPDIMNEAFSAAAIYRIPLGGNVMVAPGESLLLCDNGINHKEANENSFDLTKADFEWYDESSNPNFVDVDSEVPNMERIYTYSATIWAPHNRGFKSFVLTRLGDDEANQLTKEDYLENYHYEYSYDFVYPGGVIPMSSDAYKIPNKWILDAVNLSVESEFQWIVTSPALDKGWTYCGKVDRDKTRYGKSVRRKVLSGKTLQDTNDSSADFLPEQTADPYFKFHE